jgi:sulfite reductase alpha subunit-like flavoprotein
MTSQAVTSSSPLFILYGSATGNAEHIAKDLAAKYNKRLASSPVDTVCYFPSVVCCELDQFKKKCVATWEQDPVNAKHAVVIVTSTTGNADPPENASRFVRYIKRKTTVETMPFRHCAFAVLGLGDTNYNVFCAVAKEVDRKLFELGGTRVLPLTCADEGTGTMEDTVEPWTEMIFDEMTIACQGSAGGKSLDQITGGVANEAHNSREDEVSNKAAPLEQSDRADAVEREQVNQSTREEDISTTHNVSSSGGIALANSVNSSAPTDTTLPSSATSTSPLFILYGSATGNAEQIAKDLAARYTEQLKQNPSACYFQSAVCYELDQFKKKCVHIWEQEPPVPTSHGIIIVTSTTGNADPPENASRFARYIKRKTTVETMPFRHCTFAVLGLGDTNYDVFCAVAKELDRKLFELGGTRLQPLVCADEGTGTMEDTVEPWTASIFEKMSIACRGAGTTNTGSASSELTQSVDGTSPKKPAATIGTTQTLSSDVTSSIGVRTVRSLLQRPVGELVWNVDVSTLPSLTSCMSSCELIDSNAEEGDEEKKIADRPHENSVSDSISTTSSGFHFTMKHPFHAKILGARYLTQTPTQAAQSVARLLEGSIDKNALQPSTDQLVEATRIYDEHFPIGADHADADRNSKRVIELTLSLPDDYTLEYSPGDSLGMLVENPPQATSFILSMLRERHDMSPDQLVSIDSDHPITVGDAVRTAVDLCSPLKNKRVLNSLAQHALDPEEACVLQLLASKTPEGEEQFRIYVEEQRLTVVDVLREFPSCQNISLEGLLSILPSIPPRYYSVSSSPIEHNKLKLAVAFSVVDYLTPGLLVNGQERGRRRVHGVATHFLETICSSLLSGTAGESPYTLKIFPKPTVEFRMPEKLSIPLILIGPGTGIAPFMGFLAHRRALATFSESTEAAQTVVEGNWRGGYEMEENELPIGEHDASGLKVGVDFRSRQNIGPVEVFFGCRHCDHDWLYRDEMKTLEAQGVLSRLYTAFSRDAEQRRYVQDVMRDDPDCRARIVRLIVEEGARVYVCGDGNEMAKDVQVTIAELLGERLVGGVDRGQTYLEGMKKEKRFLLDIWS